MKIAIDTLSVAQQLELFQHFMELDQVRVAGNVALTAALLEHPDFTDSLADLVNAWSADSNALGEASDAEILRIASGVPKTTN